MIAILVIFDISYIIRLIIDKEYLAKAKEDSVFLCMIEVFTGLIGDIIPVSLILFIHTLNFKTIRFVSI